MKKRLFTLTLCICFFILQALAQEKVVTGKVTDDLGPLPGVSVIIKDTKIGTSTNSDGNYTLRVSPGQVLIFNFLGTLPQERTVGGESVINVTLASDQKSLDEVVVVGYGTQRKADLTGAVSTVDVGKTLGSRPIVDIGRGLQGAVPGLTITTLTGDLGTNPRIRLRGVTGSINTGTAGASPLILVDNVEIESLQMVNPDDVESISVLKDAASTSIYGTRAAWGVVLITTKSGKKGTPNRITYSNNFSFGTPTTTFNMMDPANQIITSLDALKRTSPTQNSYLLIGVTYDQSSIDKMKEWQAKYGNQQLSNEMELGRDFEIRDGKLYFYRPWDAGEMFIRNWIPQQKHDLNITGGSEKTSYNIGVGLLGQEGALKVNTDKFNRYNLTLGINTSVTDWLDVRSKILYSNTKLSTPFIFNTTSFDPWYYLYRWTATFPYGTYQGKPFRNAVTEVQQANMNDDRNNSSRISIGSTFKIIKGLTLDADYTFSGSNGHLQKTGGGTYAYDFWAFNGTDLQYRNYQPASYNNTSLFSNWTRINTGKAFATYNKDIKEHAFKLIAGGDIEMYSATSHLSQRNELLDFDKGSIALATGLQTVNGNANQFSTLGFFGRLNYSYKSKFLLEVNGRFDGSSRFPVNSLWGFFPSASAGYVLTEEPFMKFSEKFMNFLKVRASYGSVGNQAVGANRFLSTMSSSLSGWLLPANNVRTMGAPTSLSPVLTWETVTTTDIGLDARFLNDRLGLTLDWYRRTTSDMITSGVTLPSTYGAAAPVRNYGALEGTGWEMAIDFNHRFSNGLQFNVTGSLADAREKITNFSDLSRQISGNYEGRYIGEIWGYETDRLFQTSDFDGVDAGGKYIYKAGVPSQKANESGAFFTGPGDVKYKDLNGDGVISLGSSTVDDPGDQRIIGNSSPRYQYGLRLSTNWKGFDFDTYFQGVGSRQVWAGGKLQQPGNDNSTFGAAWFDYQLDYWTSTNTGAFYSRPTNNASWNYRSQTRYLLNMAYTRLKNVTLGYTVPVVIKDKLKMQKLRVYFSGENLLTFDHVGKIPVDPETDQGAGNTFGASYPYMKSFSFGLQLTY